MKMMAMPLSASLRRALTRMAASLSVSTAVGSSRTRSFVVSRSTSRAISVNCRCPTGISWISMSGSTRTPRVSMALAARWRMAGRSKVWSRSPKSSTKGE